MIGATVKYLRFSHTHAGPNGNSQGKGGDHTEGARRRIRRVWLGRTPVRKIKMVTSLTGKSAVVIINDSKVLYLSNFIRYDVRIE